MKTKRIWKLGLSLIIAVAFILPTGAMADTGGQGASDGQIINEMKIIENPGQTREEIRVESPLQEQEVCIVDINLLPKMPVDCYDVNITLENTLLGFPTDCEIKAFIDIFKEEEIPTEEIICFDFEDTWDIYNYWDSVDDTTDGTSGPGGIDTWCRTDQRSSSPSYSMRSTQFDDHYMGNQLDYLMAHIENTENYDEIVVDFSSWVDGEIINYYGDLWLLEDYGWCEYSFDGISWTSFGDYYYDEPVWNTSKTHTIPGTTGQADIYFRFAWTTGPTIQNEGWYVDDVCFSGRESTGLGALVFTSHSLHQFVVPGGNGTQYVFEFPETWCPDEGNYTIRIWLLSETPDCDVCYPQADPFFFDVTIGDVYDIAITDNCIVSPASSPFEMGDDLVVEGTVCNEGTLDATNLPVTFSIKRQVIDTHYDDLVEGAYYPDDYIPYHFENPDSVDGTIHGCNFGAVVEDPEYSQSGFWHIDELNSVSPTHSWFNADDTDHYPAGISDALVVNFPAMGIDDLEDMADAIDFDVKFQVNWKLDTDDAVFGYMVFGNSWSSFGGTRTGYQEPFFGDITGGFVEYSLKDAFYWCASEYGLLDDMGDMNPILYFAQEYSDGLDITEATGVGIGLDSNDRTDTVGDPTGTWSGVMIDNIKVISVWEGSEVSKEVVIIDELKAATPSDPKECEDVEFRWEEMPTGHFIEKKSVPMDDNEDNNEMTEPFSVEVLWAEIDEDDVEHYDLTAGLDSHWHVTTSGYDHYLWCGEESTGSYGDDWNDVLLFAPDKDPELDWSGGSVIFDLDEYCEIEVGSDEVIMEINPHVSDPGYSWYAYDPQPTPVQWEDFETPPAGGGAPFAAPGWATTDNIGGQGWFQVPYGWGYDPGWYIPSQVVSPIQYAVSDVWIWGPVDESIIYGPLDFTLNPATTVDYVTTFIVSGTTSALEVNVWSGGVTPQPDIMTMLDYNTPDNVGYITGEPYCISEFTIDSQHSTLTDPTQVYVQFKHAATPTFGVECFGIDDLFLLGNQLPPPGVSEYGWRHTTYTFAPDMFVNPITSDTFLNEIGAFTDDLGFRLRFTSDENTHVRGILVDDVHIHDGVGGDLFALDECDDLDNFLLDTVVSGDWWYYDLGYGGWVCQDQISGYIPNDVDCALVWDTSVPQAVAAELRFTHEFDLQTDDYCYLEFSTDGGSSWIAPVRYTGVGSGDVEIDMSSFTGKNVLIRWRVSTDEDTMSNVYKVKDVKIFADIDIHAPVTVGSLSGTVLHGWYSSPVTFTAIATDDYSGVAATYYKIDGGSTMTYSSPVTISVNGEHYVEYWSVDKVGNEEAHHTTATFKIDTGSAPSVAITAPGDGLYLFGNQLISLSGRTIIIGGFTVQATASDSDSGVYRVQFALDGTVFGEDTSSPYSAYCGEKHTGAGSITVTAEDFTGNTASAQKAITYFKFL
jgi:hypothetical protein